MTTSILIATHKRNHVLKWNLQSIFQYKNDVEVIVLDDYYEPDIECQQLVQSYKQFNIKYIHSGKTKQGKNIWRVPGFAYNIGAKQSTGHILIICCGEMYQFGDTVKFISELIKQDENQLCSVNGLDDNGYFLNKLVKGKQITLQDCLSNDKHRLQITLPFFMGVSRRQFFDINGYDETFTGVSYDDDDIIQRLLRNGAKMSHNVCKPPIKYEALINIPNNLFCIHLNTPHISSNNCDMKNVYYNQHLFNMNNTNYVIKANLTTDWGIL